MKTPTDNLATRFQYYFLTPYDTRYDSLKTSTDTKWSKILKDVTAGMIVSMIAIPMTMGYAIACGLSPVHGLIGCTVSGILGPLFGGSRYEVYGPTASAIPIMSRWMHHHGSTPQTYEYGYAAALLFSLIAGLIVMLMGLSRFGKPLIRLIPHSVVVGFTIGIAISITFSQSSEILGIRSSIHPHLISKITGIWTYRHEFNIYCFSLALLTFVISHCLSWVSTAIPSPFIALTICTIVTDTWWYDKNILLVSDKYGRIPSCLWNVKFVPPASPSVFLNPFTFENFVNFVYPILSITFIIAIEPLLCCRMGERTALALSSSALQEATTTVSSSVSMGSMDGKTNENISRSSALIRTCSYSIDFNKEMCGQGLINIVVPLCNGYNTSGSFARTATNIKLGAQTPLSNVFKSFFIVLFTYVFSQHLERVPVACIGGVLIFAASNMINMDDIRKVFRVATDSTVIENISDDGEDKSENNRGFDVLLMVLALMIVPLTDFTLGVLVPVCVNLIGKIWSSVRWLRNGTNERNIQTRMEKGEGRQEEQTKLLRYDNDSSYSSFSLKS